MYLCIRQNLNHLSSEEYKILRRLLRAAKCLTNEALYIIRQYYFATKKYLSYSKVNAALKSSPNYKELNSNISQQILMQIDSNFKSFFALKKQKRKARMPKYLDKNGFAPIIIGFVRINDSKLLIPYSNTFKKSNKPIIIDIPPILKDKVIKQIRIIPKYNARFFEIMYIYENKPVQRSLNKQNAMALDFGVSNLMTAVTNDGKAFIVDGRKIKSINQYFNKKNSYLQSIKDKQKLVRTKQIDRLWQKRSNQINDYLQKAAKIVIDYCIKNNIGTLVVGNNDFQRSTNLGHVNNQNFVNIPYGKLKNKLAYLCELNNIQFILQDESYTSKASFFDKDELPPLYDGLSHEFSGKRIYRGLYKTATGRLLNADVNGALNILAKSNVVDLSALYDSGVVNTPKRIRVA